MFPVSYALLWLPQLLFHLKAFLFSGMYLQVSDYIKNNTIKTQHSEQKNRSLGTVTGLTMRGTWRVYPHPASPSAGRKRKLVFRFPHKLPALLSHRPHLPAGGKTSQRFSGVTHCLKRLPFGNIWRGEVPLK